MTIDRSNAVNLAGNLRLKGGDYKGCITERGVHTLVDAVLLMDGGIRSLEQKLTAAESALVEANQRILGYARAVDALHSQLAAAQRDARWVSVAERFPDEGVDVICYWGDHCPCEIGTFSRGGQFGTIWQASCGDMHEFDADPTHWILLPAPPALSSKGETQ